VLIHARDLPQVNIPTLNEWMLASLALSLLLIGAGALRCRQR